jgi:hypothetical protein
MLGCSLGPCGRTLMLFLKAWSHVSPRCGLSTILCNKSKGGKKKFTFTSTCQKPPSINLLRWMNLASLFLF